MQGDGSPVLLLHGFPQHRAAWRKVAPRLAVDHTVVTSERRGYGERSALADGPFGKRTMAADAVAVMSQLGHERFAVVGHDRCGLVAHGWRSTSQR